MTAENNAPLNDYLGPVLTYKKLIAAVALVTIGLGVAAGFAAPVSYSATTSILVYPISADPTKTLGADEASIDMPTELRIATSQAVVDSASARMIGASERIDPATLGDSVTASSPKESSILDITVDASTAAKAKAGADAIAGAYLDFRAELANSNKRAAQTSIDNRLGILNERLAEVEGRLDRARNGSTEQAILAVERNSVQSEIAAQQTALADLSTLTVDATSVIDVAVTPEAPSGLGLIPIVVGSVAGGLVLGVIAAYAAAALKASAPSATPARRPDEELAPADAVALTPGQPASTDDLVPVAAVSTSNGTGPTLEAATGDPSSAIETPSDIETAKSAVAEFEKATEADAADEVPAEAEDSTTEVEAAEVPVEIPDQVPADQVLADAVSADQVPADEVSADEVPADKVSANQVPADEVSDETSRTGEQTEPADQAQSTTDPVSPLASVSDRDPERRETYTVQTADEERRALHINGNSQSALTATPNMDSLLEHLQQLGTTGPIVGLTLGEEGVGTSIAVAFDLADALQSLGAKVLMIDACHDDPLLASLLSVDTSPGLAEVLTGQSTLRSAVRPVGGLRGLDALTIGQVAESTVDAITGAPFERLLAEAKVDYHSILIISGAVSDTETVPALAALSDGLIVGTTQKPGGQASAELCSQLAALPAPTLEFLSEMLVVERSDGAVVVGAASM